MTISAARRTRNPAATRELILQSARTLISRDGLEGMSVSAVATLAGVNRGTAYQHFPTREQLVAETLKSVSDVLFRSAFGDPVLIRNRRVENVDIVQLTRTLADFAIENPILCRIWFLQLLASDDPAKDPFWGEYASSLKDFAKTKFAEPGMDSEVFALLTLAGNFLWPVWAKAHEKSRDQRRKLAERFANEIMRLALHGSMKVDHFPDMYRVVSKQIKSGEKAKRRSE